MDKILKLKLKRAPFVALLEQERLDEALIEYQSYKKNFNCLVFSKEAKEELKAANIYFCQKLDSIGQKALKENKFDVAIKCFENIFNLSPCDTTNLNNYISVLEKIKQNDLALEVAKKLVKVEENEKNLKTLANLYGTNKQNKAAIEAYKKSLKTPDKEKWSTYDYNTLACYYFNLYTKENGSLESIQEAYNLYKLAVEKKPENKIYLHNLISASNKSKHEETEKKCWEACIKLGYMNDEDWFTYSAFLMRTGDVEGWAKYYDYRFKRSGFEYLKDFKQPIWKGEDVSDKTLLIRCEQGFGDNFLMWGYMPRLTKLAKKIIFIAQDEIADLLRNNEYGVEIIAKSELNLKKINYDYFCPCMSIPFALKLNRENISVGEGFIKAPENLVKECKEKYFNTDKLKVGFAFLGLVNKTRDIPFESLLKLDKLKNAHFYCLSKSVSDKQLKKFKHNKVTNIVADFKTFAETAAAIENLDIVVSSDNCILNLAGALGKKTIGIFSYHYEFRWYDLSGEDSGWFTSVKPIINNEFNDWNLSMQKAVDEVTAFQKSIGK